MTPPDDPASAEVTPVPGREAEAARILRRLGFHVYHIGPTISVAGSKELWAKAFRVRFEADAKESGRSWAPPPAILDIPEALRGVILEIALAGRPELFRGRCQR